MSSLAELLDIFDVQGVAHATYVGDSDGGARNVVDGSQLLAQSIVAAAKTTPGKSVRSAHAAFSRTVSPDRPVTFDVAILHNGRSFAHEVVTVRQEERVCAAVQLLLDVPQPDLVRHGAAPARSTSPDDAIPVSMPLAGRELRLVGVRDPNDAKHTGPPLLDAWLRYDLVPDRDDLAKALLSHFTGHLSISTTLRAHAAVGTEMAHKTISTAVMAIDVVFHEPVGWDGWLLYAHDSTYAGAGMSYVQGQVFTESGTLLASFGQQGMIRSFAAQASAAAIPVEARL